MQSVRGITESEDTLSVYLKTKLNGEEAERADRLRQIQRERERADGPYAVC
jgi:hypothetical protein